MEREKERITELQEDMGEVGGGRFQIGMQKCLETKEIAWEELYAENDRGTGLCIILLWQIKEVLGQN